MGTNKYNARKIALDGYTFDSQREAARYGELLLLQKAGEISGLEVHPALVLQQAFAYRGKHVRAIKYEADFSYIEDGTLVYEDVKGKETADFRIKWKLAQYLYRDDAWVEFRKVR